MNKLFIFVFMFGTLSHGFAKGVRRQRIKRNVFDPSLPAYPNPNTPFYQQPPYPIPPASTMSPASALMPRPPKHWDTDNPFMESMDDPINPNYGLGLTALQPTILGGNVNFPVGNLMRPQESVGGTFGFVRPVAARFGTQGGPFFPWQDKQYAKTIKEINTSNAMARAARRDQENFDPTNDDSAVQPLPLARPPQFRPFQPVLPPPIPN